MNGKYAFAIIVTVIAAVFMAVQAGAQQQPGSQGFRNGFGQDWMDRDRSFTGQDRWGSDRDFDDRDFDRGRQFDTWEDQRGFTGDTWQDQLGFTGDAWEDQRGYLGQEDRQDRREFGMPRDRFGRPFDRRDTWEDRSRFGDQRQFGRGDSRRGYYEDGRWQDRQGMGQQSWDDRSRFGSGNGQTGQGFGRGSGSGGMGSSGR